MARIRVVLLTLLVSCAPPGTPTAEQVTPSVVDGQESARLFVDIVGAGDVLIMPRGIEHEGGYLYENGTDVTLTAVPAQNWELVQWEGAALSSVGDVTIPPLASATTITLPILGVIRMRATFGAEPTGNLFSFLTVSQTRAFREEYDRKRN